MRATSLPEPLDGVWDAVVRLAVGRGRLAELRDTSDRIENLSDAEDEEDEYGDE